PVPELQHRHGHHRQAKRHVHEEGTLMLPQLHLQGFPHILQFSAQGISPPPVFHPPYLPFPPVRLPGCQSHCATGRRENATLFFPPPARALPPPARVSRRRTLFPPAKGYGHLAAPAVQ